MSNEPDSFRLLPSEQPVTPEPNPSKKLRTSSTILWDMNNIDERELVLVSPKYKNVLNSKRSEVIECVDVERLFPHLIQLDVIDKNIQAEIEVNATRAKAVERLIDHLERGPCWKLHGFCKALSKTDQVHILELLGLNPSAYDDQASAHHHVSSPCSGPGAKLKRHFYTCEGSNNLHEISMDMLPGILEHCEASVRQLMRVALFDLDEDIMIDLTNLYFEVDTACKVDEKKSIPINARQLFNKLHQAYPPNTVRVEGDAGSGKSTCVRRYAYNWCREMLQCHEKGPESECEGHSWQLVVYIAAQSITISQKNAIRENVHCKESRKDKLLSLMDEPGVLIIDDGVDELEKANEKESIRQFTENCQKHGTPKVLVVSRSGLCHVEGRWFDRCIDIRGFSLDQGVIYVKNYFKVRHDLTEHSVLSYISQHKAKLEWLLTNPLRCHIFSELAASGELTLEDVANLSTIKLLKVLEAFILRRDERCRGADSRARHSSLFYQLCLFCILKHDPKISEHEIGCSSPYRAYLEMNKRIDLEANENRFFLFVHQMFLEHFAVLGLVDYLKNNPDKKKALLLFLCSNPNMRNVLQMTAAYVSEYEPSLLADVIFIIQASFILQTEHAVCDVNEVTEGLLQLPDLIRDTVSYDVLYQGLTPALVATVDEAFVKIQSAFNQNADLMCRAGFFNNTYERDESSQVSYLNVFVMDCIKHFTPDVQKKIYGETISKLLPSIRCNVVGDLSTNEKYDEYVFPVASTRWGEVRDGVFYEIKGTLVSVWSPSDLVSTLEQYDTYRLQPPTSREFILDLSGPASLWGGQQNDDVTSDAWILALCTMLAHGADGILLLNHKNPDSATPLDGLLGALQQTVPPEHKLAGGVGMLWGQVSEEGLVTFCEWARTIKLKVELDGVRVLLKDDRDQDSVTLLHLHISTLVERGSGEVTGLKYVTPDGKTVVPSRHVGESQ